MRWTAPLLVGIALAAGCGDDTVNESQDLATLRTLNAPFQSFEAGKAAGYSEPFMGCFASDSGATGIHYQNTAIHLTATLAWKSNPSGLYANWNPHVTCQFAPQTAAAAHS